MSVQHPLKDSERDSGEFRFKFCPRDGTPLVMTRIDGRDRPTCPKDGFAEFMFVQIGANTIVERDGGVLLVRRVEISRQFEPKISEATRSAASLCIGRRTWV